MYSLPPQFRSKPDASQQESAPQEVVLSGVSDRGHSALTEEQQERLERSRQRGSSATVSLARYEALQKQVEALEEQVPGS
jgi:hypothetical protein